MRDILDREATDLERRLVGAYEAVAGLLREAGLAPTTEANLKEAAAALFVAMNELGVAPARPDDLRL